MTNGLTGFLATLGSSATYREFRKL